MNARARPPIIAKPPVAALTAAFVGLTAGLVLVGRTTVPLPLGFVRVVARVVGPAVVVPLTVIGPAVVEAITVLVGLGMEVVTPVTVDERDVVLDAVVLTLVLEVLELEPVLDVLDELEPPTMWNGWEYWKVVGALSREILIP
jgi:hypothetical protein